jgi:tRNA pseudouridine55 synthase
MDGILNINKPSGKTSFSIVAMVKRLSGERRVGHAGTLDPIATGVLPVCFGQGTRVIDFLINSSKAYQAQIELGIATDTYDASGKITHQESPAGITREHLQTILASFHGVIQQIPPMYSAIKYHGKPLYKLARAGIKIELQSRFVKVYRLELVDWQSPVATIEIECSKGTYIRSLAHDLGQALGCGANLKKLVRSRCGMFDIVDSVSIPKLEEAFHYGYWYDLVYPLDIVLSHWMAIVVNDDTGQAIRNGRPFIQEEINSKAQHSVNNRCRVYTRQGHFLGVMRFNHERGQWQAEKVFKTGL